MGAAGFATPLIRLVDGCAALGPEAVGAAGFATDLAALAAPKVDVRAAPDR